MYCLLVESIWLFLTVSFVIVSPFPCKHSIYVDKMSWSERSAVDIKTHREKQMFSKILITITIPGNWYNVFWDWSDWYVEKVAFLLEEVCDYTSTITICCDYSIWSHQCDCLLCVQWCQYKKCTCTSHDPCLNQLLVLAWCDDNSNYIIG